MFLAGMWWVSVVWQSTFLFSGLISRLKYPVSQHQRSAPSTAGLGYGKLAWATLQFPGGRSHLCQQ